MGIRSNAFGGVHLTGADAKKFHDQVRYGRPKAAARETLELGRAITQQLATNGVAKLRLKEPA